VEAKKRSVNQSGENNYGFDDEQALYIHVYHDHVAYRYEILKVRPRDVSCYSVFFTVRCYTC